MATTWTKRLEDTANTWDETDTGPTTESWDTINRSWETIEPTDWTKRIVV